MDPDGWRQGESVEADFRIVRTPRQEVFTITAPLVFTDHSATTPPIMMGTDNALMRPFATLLTKGKPVVGRVQYYFVRAGGDVRTLFALAIRDHPSSLRAPRLLPGSIFLFPGFGREGVEHASGIRVRPHHVSIRETENGIMSYLNGTRLDNGLPERFEAEIDAPAPGSMVHVATSRVAAPRLLDPAGIAYAPISEPVRRARAGRPFLPDAVVRNHWVDVIRTPGELGDGAHHLWNMAMLTESVPSDEEVTRTLRWFQYVEELRGGQQIVPREYDGTVPVSATALDLRAVGIPAQFRYLVVLRGIFPGSIPAGTMSFALPAVVPGPDVFPVVPMTYGTVSSRS